MKTENLFIVAAGVGTLAFLALKKKNDAAIYDTTMPDVPVSSGVPTTTTTPAPAATSLNQNKILKKGVLGAEVTELQKKLGVSADGNFGPQTETALYNKKAVKQITLATYNSTPNVNTAALSIGTRVMAYKSPEVVLYKNSKLADGSYYNTKEEYTTVDYGDVIGKIVQVSNPYKSHYIVEYINWFGSKVLVWVAAAEVKKI